MIENTRCMLQPEVDGIECKKGDCDRCGYNPKVAIERHEKIRKKYGLKYRMLICEEDLSHGKKEQFLIRVKNEQWERIQELREPGFGVNGAELKKVIGLNADRITRFKLENHQEPIWTIVHDYEI